MGGSGSSRWVCYTKKDTVEDCRWIDIRRWKRENMLRPGYFWRWWWRDADTGKENASMNIQTYPESVELIYTITWRNGDREDIRYRVPLTWTACNFGGERPWFVYPGKNCGRRVAKLYMPPGARYFLCRHCHDLTYKSRQEHDKRMDFHRKSHEAVLRLLKSLRDSDKDPDVNTLMLAVKVMNQLCEQ